MSDDLVAWLRGYANECGGGHLEDDLNAAIAALTAQSDCMEALIKEGESYQREKQSAYYWQDEAKRYCTNSDYWRQRAEKSEAEAAALREELRKQAAEAYTDVEAWGAYASEYFQAKWNLDGDLKKWTERAAIKETK